MRSIEDIARDLRTQDNRITELPIFVVQQRRRTYGLSNDYTDEYTWIDQDGEEVSGVVRVKLERFYKRTGYSNTLGNVWYWRVGCRDTWEFVTACMTESGANEYIRANGHNLKEPRVYVESGYRNAEWKVVREHLMREHGPTVATAEWVKGLVEALRETNEALKQAEAVAKGPAKSRMQRGIDAVRSVLDLLAMGAIFTAKTHAVDGDAR